LTRYKLFIMQKIIDIVKLKGKELDSVLTNIDTFKKTLIKRIKEEKIVADAVIGGSTAKGTVLKGDFDCDIFVRFDLKYKKDDISAILGRILKKEKPERVHGSRDYFQLKKNGIEYEIIPVLKVNTPSQAENVTDMSPMHVKWIKSKLVKKPRLADQILLTKTFCKANGLYGAESFIGGFSGHVLDILIVKYGSFEKLLKASSKWKDKDVIDVEKHGDVNKLNKSKLSSLIIIDPVDNDRNAAAALKREKIILFKTVALKYLKKPDEKFFIKRRLSMDDLKKKAKGKNLFLFRAVPKKGKIDVIGSKLLKVFEHMAKQLEFNDFVIVEKGWDWDRETTARLWYILKKDKLDSDKIQMGPHQNQEKNAERFKKKHPKAYVKNKRLYAKVKREFTDVKTLFKTLLKSEYVKTRVRKIQ